MSIHLKDLGLIYLSCRDFSAPRLSLVGFIPCSWTIKCESGSLKQRKAFNDVLCSSLNEAVLLSADQTAAIATSTLRPPVFASLWWLPVFVRSKPGQELLSLSTRRMLIDAVIFLPAVHDHIFREILEYLCSKHRRISADTAMMFSDLV